MNKLDFLNAKEQMLKILANELIKRNENKKQSIYSKLIHENTRTLYVKNKKYEYIK